MKGRLILVIIAIIILAYFTQICLNNAENILSFFGNFILDFLPNSLISKQNKFLLHEFIITGKISKHQHEINGISEICAAAAGIVFAVFLLCTILFVLSGYYTKFSKSMNVYAKLVIITSFAFILLILAVISILPLYLSCRCVAIGISNLFDKFTFSKNQPSLNVDKIIKFVTKINNSEPVKPNQTLKNNTVEIVENEESEFSNDTENAKSQEEEHTPVNENDLKAFFIF